MNSRHWSKIWLGLHHRGRRHLLLSPVLLNFPRGFFHCFLLLLGNFLYLGVNMTLGRVVRSSFKQVTCLVGHSSAWWFPSQWWHPSLCSSWVCPISPHILQAQGFFISLSPCFRIRWDPNKDFFNSSQVFAPLHPCMAWCIFHQVAALFVKYWRAYWTSYFLATKLLLKWFSMFWIHSSASMWVTGLENTSPSSFIIY